MKKRTTRVLVAVATAVATTIIGMPAAHASGTITWRDDATGRCLMVGSFTSSSVVTGNCTWSTGNPNWVDVSNSDGTWLEAPAVAYGNRQGGVFPCLTAYWDNSVYLENCSGSGNDYERWYEEWQGNGWRLRNKATGLYLDSNSSGSVYALPWNGGNYQLWH